MQEARRNIWERHLITLRFLKPVSPKEAMLFVLTVIMFGGNTSMERST
jgi:hypothetical protein